MYVRQTLNTNSIQYSEQSVVTNNVEGTYEEWMWSLDTIHWLFPESDRFHNMNFPTKITLMLARLSQTWYEKQITPTLGKDTLVIILRRLFDETLATCIITAAHRVNYKITAPTCCVLPSSRLCPSTIGTNERGLLLQLYIFSEGGIATKII